MLEFRIATQWDSRATGHEDIILRMSSADKGIRMTVDAPFFNDPPNPGGKPGEPFPKLWEYEVVEAFFLAKDDKYLEVEVSPHGQHLVLILSGYRNIVKDEIPLTYKSSIDGSKWHGEAFIPDTYFPPGVNKFNAYAIHGSGEQRMYESLFPVPQGKYAEPEFHRLEYFQDIDFESVLKQDPSPSSLWTF